MTDSTIYDTIQTMPKREKKEQRIRQNPHNVSLDDFEALIKRYGEIIERHKHPKAHVDDHLFPYKRQNPVSAYYVEQVFKLIDELKRS